MLTKFPLEGKPEGDQKWILQHLGRLCDIMAAVDLSPKIEEAFLQKTQSEMTVKGAERRRR